MRPGQSSQFPPRVSNPALACRCHAKLVTTASPSKPGPRLPLCAAGSERPGTVTVETDRAA